MLLLLHGRAVLRNRVDYCTLFISLAIKSHMMQHLDHQGPRPVPQHLKHLARTNSSGQNSIHQPTQINQASSQLKSYEVLCLSVISQETTLLHWSTVGFITGLTEASSSELQEARAGPEILGAGGARFRPCSTRVRRAQHRIRSGQWYMG